MSRTNKSWPTMTVPSFAKSSSILPAFRESTATSICLIWSWLLAVGPVNYRTRASPSAASVSQTCFGQLLRVPLVIDSAIWGTLIVSATNDVYFSLSFEQKGK